VSKHFVIPTAKTKPLRAASGALDVAARYLVYKLYDASKGANPASPWQSVRALGEATATVSRAIELGWLVIRDDGTAEKLTARAKDLWAALTEEGRAVARKALR
jgi:hypothetical protein